MRAASSSLPRGLGGSFGTEQQKASNPEAKRIKKWKGTERKIHKLWNDLYEGNPRMRRKGRMCKVLKTNNGLEIPQIRCQTQGVQRKIKTNKSTHLKPTLECPCQTAEGQRERQSHWKQKACSGVKRVYGACRAPELRTQLPRQMVHNACKSSSRGSDALFWPLQAPALMTTNPYTDAHLYK